MNRLLLASLASSLTLAGCATVPAKSPCPIPEKAASFAELEKSLPEACLSNTNIKVIRADSGKSEMWFFKSQPGDRAPVRVGVYDKTADGVALAFTADLPVPADACRSGGCEARRSTGMARRPTGDGFQLSIDNAGGDFFVSRYQFVREGNDFRLVLKILSLGTYAEGPKMRCARLWQFDRGKRVDTLGKRTATVPLSPAEWAPKFLVKDRISYEKPDRASLCVL